MFSTYNVKYLLYIIVYCVQPEKSFFLEDGVDVLVFYCPVSQGNLSLHHRCPVLRKQQLFDDDDYNEDTKVDINYHNNQYHQPFDLHYIIMTGMMITNMKIMLLTMTITAIMTTMMVMLMFMIIKLTMVMMIVMMIRITMMAQL